MDLALWLTLAGLSLTAVALTSAAFGTGGPAEMFRGLFANPFDLGWPVGVQEEDLVRSWGAAQPRLLDHPEPDPDDAAAAAFEILDDAVEPVPTIQVRPAH